jgi:uncharacterized membrane protein YcfT
MAIVLVVLHHSIQYGLDAGMIDTHWGGVTEFLRTMRMPLFFMAAGLFAGKWVRTPWRELLRSKVLLLLWVYALWVVIRWLWYLAVPGVDVETGIKALIVHAALPLGGWFIFTLAIFFVIARATNRVPPRLQLAIAAAASLVWFAGWLHLGNHGYDGVGYFYVFFVLGCYWRDNIARAAIGLRLWSMGLIVLAWPLVYLGLDLLQLTHAPVLSLAIRMLGLAAGISLAVVMQRLKILRWLGQRTLLIYMSHTLFIFTIVWALEASGVEAPAMEYWLPMALVVVALLLSLGLGILAQRVGLGALYDTPRWMLRLFDSVWDTRFKVPSTAANARV